ncbi:MAG: hypothetical protein JXM71_09455, partial [Spirochaetales bacterium]|nr:hypothetical protein [Spirochaetales bacterium]
MTHRNRTSSLIIISWVGLTITGTALFALLVAAALGLEVPLGTILLEGLSWAAFIIPAYPWAGAIIIAMPGFRYDLLFGLVGSIAPFVSLALTARFIDGVSPRVGGFPSLGVFGPMSGAIFGFFVTFAAAAVVVAIMKRVGAS